MERTMNHDQAVLILTDYLQGRLDAGRRQAMAEHLRGCNECSELGEAYRVLAMGGSGDPMTEAHPTTEEIVEFTTARDRLDDAARRRMVEHLQNCAACRDEIEMTRDAEQSAMASTVKYPGHAGRPSRNWPLLALAATWLLILVGLPMLISTQDEAPHTPATWSGPVSLPVLTATRQGGGEKTIRMRRGQPFVPIALLPSLPPEGSVDQRFRFSIVAASGETAWETDMTRSSIEAELAESQVVTFLIPAPALNSGRYLLRITGISTPAGGLVAEIAFVLERDE